MSTTILIKILKTIKTFIITNERAVLSMMIKKYEKITLDMILKIVIALAMMIVIFFIVFHSKIGLRIAEAKKPILF